MLANDQRIVIFLEYKSKNNSKAVAEAVSNKNILLR